MNRVSLAKFMPFSLHGVVMLLFVTEGLVKATRIFRSVREFVLAGRCRVEYE